LGKVVSLCVILTPQLKAPQGVISPTNGIKAHGGVRQCGKVMKVPSQMESENMVPFTVGAAWMGCVYLEPTQVYIAQGKANKSHTTMLEKYPTKRVANEFEQ
jgi:hypothetical protein